MRLLTYFICISVTYACHTVKMVELEAETSNIRNSLNNVVYNVQTFLRKPSVDGFKQLLNLPIEEKEYERSYNSSEPCNDVAMVELQTTYSWNESKTAKYGQILRNEMNKLERYSGTSASSLGSDMKIVTAKIHTTQAEYFGQRIFVSGVTKQCPRIKEFVRKAVSWSTNISFATVACRCDPLLAIYKV